MILSAAFSFTLSVIVFVTRVCVKCKARKGIRTAIARKKCTLCLNMIQPHLVVPSPGNGFVINCGLHQPCSVPIAVKTSGG